MPEVEPSLLSFTSKTVSTKEELFTEKPTSWVDSNRNLNTFMNISLFSSLPSTCIQIFFVLILSFFFHQKSFFFILISLIFHEKSFPSQSAIWKNMFRWTLVLWAKFSGYRNNDPKNKFTPKNNNDYRIQVFRPAMASINRSIV